MFSLMPRSQGLCGWGEVDLEAGSFGQVLVACHLAAPVIGHRTSHLGVEAVEDLRKSLGGGLGVAVFQPNQSHEERAAFDQRAHLGAVLFALDQVALPVARDQPLQHPRLDAGRSTSCWGWTCVDLSPSNAFFAVCGRGAAG